MTDTWLVIDQPQDNAYWEKRFNDNLQNYAPWILQGDELIFSAELLHEKIMGGFKRIAQSPEGKFEALKIFCSFNLLAGYSLENYLKGLIISDISRSKNVEIKDIVGHNLVTLSSKTSLTLDQSEEELLNRFTEFSIWAGRYPVPKHYQKMKPEENYYGHKIGKHYYKTNDMKTIRGIIKKIKEIINTT